MSYAPDGGSSKRRIPGCKFLLDAFLKTREVKVVDPVEVIRKIAEERKFSQKLTDEVVSSYLVEPEPNWFGVINSFTNAAQKTRRRFRESRWNGDIHW